MGALVAFGVAEAITLTTVLESVAIVGAALSVVGMVTKNKTLSMIGAGLGLVGGVGALASGALGAASVAGDAAAAGGDAAGAAGDAAASAAASSSANVAGSFGPAFGDGAAIGAADLSTVGTTAPDVLSALAGGADPAAGLGAAPAVGSELAPQDLAALQTQQTLASTSTNAADAVAPGTTGGLDTTTGGIGNASVVPNTATPTVPGLSGPGTSQAASDLISTPPTPPSNLGAVDPTTGETITSAVDPTTGKIVDLPSSSSGLSGALGKVVDFAGAHPVVALGALQAGGSLLQGAFSSLTPAQVNALNAQASANDAAAAQQRQQTQNLAQPKAVASSAPVTGTPAPLVPGAATPGFINQPQVRAA